MILIDALANAPIVFEERLSSSQKMGSIKVYNPDLEWLGII